MGAPQFFVSGESLMEASSYFYLFAIRFKAGQQVVSASPEKETANGKMNLLMQRNKWVRLMQGLVNLKKLQRTNEEQKIRIRNTERALKKAEEERIRVQFKVACFSKEPTEVHDSWLPPWLAVHLIHCQGIGKRSINIRRRFDALIENIIREHEEARKHDTGEMKDLLNILLHISEDESIDKKLTRENIKAFIIEVFGAGTDTSALTTEWALSELINHPNIMKKAVEEIDNVVGKNRLLQESDIPNLPYLQAIVKETLRLHPTVPMIQRISTQDCIVGGYDIPAKTTIFFNVWGHGRDPTNWVDPLEFRPERFEGRKLDVRGQDFQLLPFGSGSRMCPGISLGLHVVHATLGSMIQCFEWKAGKDGNLTSVDMEEGIGITLPRANPLVCVPVVRLHPIPLSM